MWSAKAGWGWQKLTASWYHKYLAVEWEPNIHRTLDLLQQMGVTVSSRNPTTRRKKRKGPPHQSAQKWEPKVKGKQRGKSKRQAKDVAGEVADSAPARQRRRINPNEDRFVDAINNLCERTQDIAGTLQQLLAVCTRMCKHVAVIDTSTHVNAQATQRVLANTKQMLANMNKE